MITSYSSSPLAPALVGNSHIKSELNRKNSSIESRIQDVKTGPVLLKNFPIAVMDRIASFCSLKDIKNMQKSDVYSEINSVKQHKVNAIKYKYSKAIKALHEWKVSPCREKEENRNLAVKRIMDCIFGDIKNLDLSNLNLKSLPDISALDFLTALNYEGNDGSFIKSCFDRQSIYGYKLKNPSPLPGSLSTIKISFKSLMILGAERSGIEKYDKPTSPLPKEWEFIKDYYSSYLFFD